MFKKNDNKNLSINSSKKSFSIAAKEGATPGAWKEQTGGAAGVVKFHPHDTLVGRFLGLFKDEKIVVYPNHERTEEDPEWLVWNRDSNSEGKAVGKKELIGHLDYIQVMDVFQGIIYDNKIEFRPYAGKVQGAKRPDYIVVVTGKAGE